MSKRIEEYTPLDFLKLHFKGKRGEYILSLISEQCVTATKEYASKLEKKIEAKDKLLTNAAELLIISSGHLNELGFDPNSNSVVSIASWLYEYRTQPEQSTEPNKEG